MRWPPWSSESTNDEQKQTPSSWFSSAANNPSSILDWTAFTEARTILPTLVLTSGILIAVRFHRRYLRRIPDAPSISSSYLRRRSIFGPVTSVGDGDNFRIFHTPGGRMAGWGWLPWKKVPTAKKDLKDKTVRHLPPIFPSALLARNRHNYASAYNIPLFHSPYLHLVYIFTQTQIHIRLAGVDAPELAHFGRPEQPFARDAHTWLTSYLSGRRIRALVHRQDQYSRVVASVFVRRAFDFPPFRRRDVSYEMLKRGLATVYEAKVGSEFGGDKMEKKYRKAEWWAKKRAKGLWKDYGRVGSGWESPREYKNRMGMGDPLPIEKGNGKGKTGQK
ncbi:Nuclease (SNase-like) OB-fold [Penicillium concentricum]|uniref:Probable endonuclease LCL3 n=1 Tax=Penicillium concentricum TaxID=293559 RepID=A0A9W9RSE4_9EURO|nr:Nuclease (SNase-like) OB-fold [Penicillium concentricum]KAJ5365402.1 Nuclease (SNase-like) OB-fold [Penicillium concentricum]